MKLTTDSALVLVFINFLWAVYVRHFAFTKPCFVQFSIPIRIKAFSLGCCQNYDLAYHENRRVHTNKITQDGELLSSWPLPNVRSLKRAVHIFQTYSRYFPGFQIFFYHAISYINAVIHKSRYVMNDFYWKATNGSRSPLSTLLTTN